ncbi:MAG: hypothetical protein K1X55_18070, partial [Chitinophagales bacterium]|nr:hypothetical protein [Chitinophagales bacterium]
NNNLGGKIPSIVADTLKQVYLNGNNLTDTIPNLYQTNTSLDTLNISGNKFLFHHFGTDTIFLNKTNYVYAQQDSAEIGLDTTNGILSVSIPAVSGTNLIYSWYRFEDVLDDETGDTLDLTDWGSGEYYARISNSLVTKSGQSSKELWVTTVAHRDGCLASPVYVDAVLGVNNKTPGHPVKTIDYAVKNVCDNGEVIVKQGNYASFTYNKKHSITIRTEVLDEAHLLGTTIDVANKGILIGKGNTNATISGFTIVNTGSTPNTAITVKNGESSSATVTLTLNNCILKNNIAEFGGAIHAEKLANVIANNCVFDHNLAYSGGAISCRRTSDITLNHCTFFRNGLRELPANPSALYGYGKDIAISSASNIILNNSIMPNTGAIGWVDISSLGKPNNPGTFTANYSALKEINTNNPITYNGTNNLTATLTNNNIFTDPQLRSDYRLSYQSPCIAAADPNSALTDDLLYKPRPWGNATAKDIGALEGAYYGHCIALDELVCSNLVAGFNNPTTMTGHKFTACFPITYNGSIEDLKDDFSYCLQYDKDNIEFLAYNDGDNTYNTTVFNDATNGNICISFNASPTSAQTGSLENFDLGCLNFEINTLAINLENFVNFLNLDLANGCGTQPPCNCASIENESDLDLSFPYINYQYNSSNPDEMRFVLEDGSFDFDDYLYLEVKLTDDDGNVTTPSYTTLGNIATFTIDETKSYTLEISGKTETGLSFYKKAHFRDGGLVFAFGFGSIENLFEQCGTVTLDPNCSDQNGTNDYPTEAYITFNTTSSDVTINPTTHAVNDVNVTIDRLGFNRLRYVVYDQEGEEYELVFDIHVKCNE